MQIKHINRKWYLLVKNKNVEWMLEQLKDHLKYINHHDHGKKNTYQYWDTNGIRT